MMIELEPTSRLVITLVMIVIGSALLLPSYIMEKRKKGKEVANTYPENMR